MDIATVAAATPWLATEPDDTELVRAAQADPRAFEALWERYFPAIFRYCLSERLPLEDAEDIASQVFLSALGALATFDPAGGGVRAWLYTIARHQIASHRRRTMMRRFLPFTDRALRTPAGSSPEETALVREQLESQLRLLERVSGIERELLRLRWAGLSHQEIAAVLGKSHDAVRAASSRAERRLHLLREQEALHGD